MSGRAVTLNEPSAAVFTVASSLVCGTRAAGVRRCMIVTDWPAWAFETEPESVTAPP